MHFGLTSCAFHWPFVSVWTFCCVVMGSVGPLGWMLLSALPAPLVQPPVPGPERLKSPVSSPDCLVPSPAEPQCTAACSSASTRENLLQLGGPRLSVGSCLPWRLLWGCLSLSERERSTLARHWTPQLGWLRCAGTQSLGLQEASLPSLPLSQPPPPVGSGFPVAQNPWPGQCMPPPAYSFGC